MTNENKMKLKFTHARLVVTMKQEKRSTIMATLKDEGEIDHVRKAV